MMSTPTCPTCRRKIPPGKLACPGCVEDRSREAVDASQVEPLRKVAQGDTELVVRAVSSRRHIQLFGFDHTFCGLHVTPQSRRTYVAYTNTEEMNKLCTVCRLHALQIMEKVCPGSAR